MKVNLCSICVFLLVLFVAPKTFLLQIQQIAAAEEVPNITKMNNASTNNTALNNTASKSNVTMNLNTYTNATYGITMNYPVNWTYNGLPVGNNASSVLPKIHLLTAFFPTSTGIFSKSVAPTVLTLAIRDNVESFSLDAYVNKTLDQQKKNTPGFHIDYINSTTLGGNMAKKIVYDSKDFKNRPIKTMSDVALKGDQIYLLQFSAPTQSYTKYIQSAEKMKDSLKIR